MNRNNFTQNGLFLKHILFNVLVYRAWNLRHLVKDRSRDVLLSIQDSFFLQRVSFFFESKCPQISVLMSFHMQEVNSLYKGENINMFLWMFGWVN